MTAAPITPDGFEALYRADPDPWRTHESGYEATKRATLLRACGTRSRARGLEIACGVGNNTRLLARRCLRLDALDASPTALVHAACACAGLPVTFHEARLPEGVPAGPFDLIVAAEIAYYLPRLDADRLADALAARLAPGGRLVALHHTVPFHDTSQHPAAAHARLIERVGLPARSRQHGRWRVTVCDAPSAKE